MDAFTNANSLEIQWFSPDKQVFIKNKKTIINQFINFIFAAFKK